RNHVWPFASRAVKPGLVPADFSRSSTHFSGDGAVSELTPRAICSAVIGEAPMRLTNQLESGTSSMVLTLPAFVFDGFFEALTKRLNEYSKKRSMSSGLAPAALRLSGTRARGSSS